ncbi:MAG: hypothetical protein NEA02_06650, partial [Thermoanaerobaculia bacterium]|nr:hypothetical protein [Thermoanaerobaculia bacterium]
MEKASRDLDAACAAETAAREALDVAERSWESTGAALAAANTTLDESVEAARRAESELRSAESRRATLSGLRERMDWASSGVRAVLQHFRGVDPPDAGDRGIFGVMGEMIETDAAYEKAVEAVLGERMQSVVVRDHAEGLSAIHYLKESREGRGAFIPVGLRTRNEELAYLGEEGVVAPLTEIVSAPPECRELLRGLLGGTLLVRTLDTALRLWNRNGVWNSYVTLDGDVVTADGILIGGEQGTGEAGVLARKREIRGLEKEIEGMRLELDRRSRTEEEIRRERASLEERLATFFRGREEARSAHAAAERARAVLSETRAQAGALLDGRAREGVYLRGELARMTEELSASLATARQSEHARGEEEERTRTLLSETEAKRLRAEEVRERAHVAEVAYRGLEEKDRASADLRAELSEQAEGKRRMLIERRRRKADQEHEAASLEEAMRGTREAIGQGGIALAALQERIDARVAEHAECVSRLSEIEAALREARRRETEFGERQAAERLRLQRFEMDIAGLDALLHQRYEILPVDLPPVETAEGEGTAVGELSVLESRAEEIRDRMASMGEVNLASLEEHRELTERFAFLDSQKEDLEK